MNLPTPPPATAEPATTRPHAGRWLLRIGIALVLLLLLLAGIGWMAARTDAGARTVWKLATQGLQGKLTGEIESGTLANGLTVRNIVYRDKDRVVTIDRLRGVWDLSVSPRKLTITALALGQVDVTLLPQPSEPVILPEQISLPLAIDLQRLAIDQLLVHQGSSTTAIKDVVLKAGSDRLHHIVTLEQASTPWGKAQAGLQLDGARPFALAGSASLDGAWQEIKYHATTRLTGSLQALGIALDASGGSFKATARIAATPFSALPFKSARLNAEHFNPRMFNPAAPQADLNIVADITPVEQAASTQNKAPVALSKLTVAGPITVTNASPGPFDRQLLPLVSLHARARLDASAQTLTDLKLSLLGNGTLAGSGTVRAGNQGQLVLQAQGLDLHALHSAMKPSKLAGPITLQLDGDNQQVSLKLADEQLNVSAQADLTPLEIALRSARLQSGPARLDLSGTMGRGADAPYAVQGKLTDFNPARFMASMQPAAAAPKPVSRTAKSVPSAGPATPVRIPDANINMTFSAQGKRQPELQARVRFDIQDSSYDKLPMTGGGTLEVIGRQVPASDAQLTIAGNRLSVKGGFGMPGKQLAFAVNAPALERLGFGLAGLLSANGTAAGTIERPVLQANVEADKLAFGAYRVARLTGKIDTNGVPGVDLQAKLKLALDGRGVLAGTLRLDQVNADVNGSYGSHAIALTTSGTLQGQPLALTLAARGGLKQVAQTPQANPALGWTGTLQTLENRGLPRLSLQQPLTVNAAPGLLELGATRVAIENAQLDLRSLQFRQNGPLRSQGSISALDVGHMLGVWQRFSGKEAPLKTTLVLDASWNFALADAASGFFQVERQRGDIVLPLGVGASTLGLTQLRLRGDFAGNALRVDALANTARLGNATAAGRIGLVKDGAILTIAPESGIDVRIAAVVPELKSFSSLTGPRVVLAGNLKTDFRLAGTVGKPVLSGELAGSQLALTLYDQGVQLRDGVARISIVDNVAELREVVFRGGDGSVRASGRIPLDQDNPAISATLIADRLQLLADPSAQLTLSGQANLANVGQQLKATGKFTVDRALFTLPEESAPRLDSDVVVYRNGAKPAAQTNNRARSAAEKPAGRFAPSVDIQLALGERFRFKGSGADLRLAGQLSVQTGPGEPMQAFGTVRIVDGSYRAFGAELEIERGLLNFTGPLTDPNVNITAMRRRQEVAAGVQVTGTVRQPRVTLVSDPNVADEEKMSWLVFGHAGNSTGGGAQAAARGAATGLLNKVGGERLAKGLGLDQFSFGSSEFGMEGQQVVNLGKNISDKLAIGYEQSLAGAASVLKLTYQLSQNWSVVLRGGQIAGLDLSYSRRFDHFGRSNDRRQTPLVNNP